ncbi:aminopeptidase N [Scaptodrosophila lebanonensis]|uniref:Aminopeptidase N n=1 Tax=Drosophila lebanonensis TaxID=7225 RepID=A0A6J2U5Q3_DROLE|nr:aminopeptidase N [Scaptodrosophila lebanonensis]
MELFILQKIFLVIAIICSKTEENQAVKRSIDLAATHALISDVRLSKDVVPTSYEIYLEPKINESTFDGFIRMNLICKADSKKIMIHAHYDLYINDRNIKLKRNTIKQGTECVLEIPFNGDVWENSEGLFKGFYINSSKNNKEVYFATNMRPNNARRVIPCFDEPEFKVPFTVSIARPKEFVILFNTPLQRSELHSSLDEYMIDFFETTPPISTFTFGLIITKLQKLDPYSEQIDPQVQPNINIWSNNINMEDLQKIQHKLELIYNLIRNFFNVTVPLKKIDIVGIPEVSFIQPVNNWGLLLIRKEELLNEGFYILTQELISQWLGSWVTPFWWADAHINKALSSFLASEIVIQIDGGVEFNGKYPMTKLYSIYYEFSKRYPHSRITAMKQETTSFKTELVIRMLHLTLGKNTFQNGIRSFLSAHFYSTFSADNLWNALTKQALGDSTLLSQYNVAEIANSWLSKDRLPVINADRDYLKKTLTVKQKVYLRERPHDVPGKDKMLWWIPITISRQDKLDFSRCEPYVWMGNTSQLNIDNMPSNDNFIIVNQEEIGPFPVNYDEQNWNLISKYLLTDDGREKVPTYTRAKLLHDAWNLAYAGDLSFTTALNMMLFMKFERNHIVWNPVFTFIDQIGRHIAMSQVHTKFEAYIRGLLAPLYEELGTEQLPEQDWKKDLRALAKKFLCQAGYHPCVKEAQNAFKFWQNSPSPNYENPVPNQYICPVFKWGSIEEWNFGLQRIAEFPKSRQPSERTFLLKSLTGCPIQPEKYNRLLQIAIIEEHPYFTDSDKILIFRTLAGSSVGYMTLFNFLTENWQILRQKFTNRTTLWDSLISSATGIFTTEEGYQMVKKLHEQHSGEFGSAEHIIQNSLRIIKEESKWSMENLPVIENWLDNFNPVGK